MILIISNIAIDAAPALVDLFPAGAASLVTASDFYQSFRAGISANDFDSSPLSIKGKNITPKDISGVITTVPCFLPVEFYYVQPQDRDYVCAEMNAFFLYFLSELSCEKCNPPDWRMFISGNVHQLEWVKTAIRLEIPVFPFRIKNGYTLPGDVLGDQEKLKCTVIYDQIMNSDCPLEVRQSTRLLARELSLPYLDCYFTINDNKEHFLTCINTVPDISTPENRVAIANNFLKNL